MNGIAYLLENAGNLASDSSAYQLDPPLPANPNWAVTGDVEQVHPWIRLDTRRRQDGTVTTVATECTFTGAGGPGLRLLLETPGDNHDDLLGLMGYQSSDEHPPKIPQCQWCGKALVSERECSDCAGEAERCESCGGELEDGSCEDCDG